MEKEKIDRIIECLENVLKRPQMFVGGNRDIDLVRSFLRGFYFAFFALFDYRITASDEFKIAHENFGLEFNSLGFEKKLLAEGILKEEIIQKIFKLKSKLGNSFVVISNLYVRNSRLDKFRE